MDGYAVRAADVVQVPASLRIVAEIPAGAGFGGVLGKGEAARIFTGAPLPPGADAVVMQEQCERAGDTVRALQERQPAPLDGDEQEPRGILLDGERRQRDVGLAHDCASSEGTSVTTLRRCGAKSAFATRCTYCAVMAA